MTEPEPFVNVQPVPHKPGTYVHTDGTVVTYPRPHTPTFDPALHERIQQRPRPSSGR